MTIFHPKRVAILQSNYIPWKGYFDIINSVDTFIFHDDLQYTKGDWRNRNLIKTKNGLKWLTIPCGTREDRLICDVALEDDKWQSTHWAIISENYHAASAFAKYKDFFRDIYLGKKWHNLSELNQHLIKEISTELLGIQSTVFDDSQKYNLASHGAQRVFELLDKVHATDYLSGPAGKNYLTDQMFRDANIGIAWIDYSGYPEYPQLYPPFEHKVSIIDLLFNMGDDAKFYMKSFI